MKDPVSSDFDNLQVNCITIDMVLEESLLLG